MIGAKRLCIPWELPEQPGRHCIAYRSHSAMVAHSWESETVNNVAPIGRSASQRNRRRSAMSMQEARPATPEEEARFRQLEHEEEARRLAQSRRQEVKGLAWSNDNSRLSRITEADGDEWLRLQFTETHEDKQGRTVFRQVECLVPCKFRVIG